MVKIGRLSFHNLRRSVPGFFSTPRTLLLVLWVVGFATVFLWQSSSVGGLRFFRRSPPAMAAPRLGQVSYSVTDLDGVGDGATRNTKAFERAAMAAPRVGPVTYSITDLDGVGDGATRNTEAFERAAMAAPRVGPVTYGITDLDGVGGGATRNAEAFERAAMAAPRVGPVTYGITDLDGVGGGATRNAEAFERAAMAAPRVGPVTYSIRDFGGVGDGVALNTKAFERAVAAIARRGGGQLNVPPGVWLTAPFNLTSHMTLFLAEGAEIRGIEDERYWPLMPPLPSYGFGREHKGPRYGSLIHGQNLKDLVITGHNGTINGQGQAWWAKFRNRLLNNTRGPLVQIMWSKNIVISNITLRDSPFWTLHPYDCKNITVTNVTILAPVTGAPNTDGIDPDSCEDVVIENCYICTGDDGIAIKSGWDQYGIVYGRPSTNILIRNLTVRSVMSAGVSIGSEMSGGVSNVMVENLNVWDSRRGIRIKTAPGRGGYIRNISYHNVTLDNVRIGIMLKTEYNEHPDDHFDPRAVPLIENISFSGIHGQGVRVPVQILGSGDIPVKGVSFRDMSVGITYKKKGIFQCSFVQGRVIGSIFPAPCENLDLYDEQGQPVKPPVSITAPTLIIEKIQVPAGRSMGYQNGIPSHVSRRGRPPNISLSRSGYFRTIFHVPSIRTRRNGGTSRSMKKPRQSRRTRFKIFNI